MQVVDVDIEKLIPDPENARTHGEKNIEAVRGSIKKFDVVEPLIVRRQNNVVVGGNCRLGVLKELGYKTVPVHYVDFDDQKAKALAIVLNRSAELAEWDDDILGKQLQGLFEDSFDIEGIGFELPELKEADLPDISDADEPECQQMTFTMHRDQVEEVNELLSKVKKEVKPEYPGNENSNGNALHYIVSKFNG